MALASPRFKWGNTFNEIAADSAMLHVSSAGGAVHLRQRALLDLGYAMSISRQRQLQS